MTNEPPATPIDRPSPESQPAGDQRDRRSTPRPAWFRWGLPISLGAYWLALFVATHIPADDLPDLPRNTDKLAHFAGYGGLAFLMTVVLATRRRLAIRELAAVFLVTLMYAGLDELLQIPAGRHADWRDVAADAVGSVVGIAAAWGVMWLLERNRGRR